METVETFNEVFLLPSSTALKRGVNDNHPPDTLADHGLFSLLPLLVAAMFLCPLVSRAVILQEVCAFGGDQRDEVVQGLDGHFYGTTQRGGTADKGTIYRVTTSGVLTTLVSFTGTNGALPLGGLMRASDGNFYGTTAYGGTNGLGTIYRVTVNGALTTLVSFPPTNGDGAIPMATLLEGHDGHFYGTTTLGGADNYGTVFRLTAGGAFDTLCSFPTPAVHTTRFVSPLTQASDGALYGTTAHGGDNNNGMVFRVSTNGLLQTVASFPGVNRDLICFPGVVQGQDGNLYGTIRQLTVQGAGNPTQGNVFKVTLSGTLTAITNFTGTNGSFPYALLVKTAEGDFYGTTTSGGAYNLGTVFRVTTSGALTTVASFDGTNGGTPYAGLALASDGHLYGVTSKGGAGGGGTFFRLTRAGELTPLASLPAVGASGNALPSGLLRATDGNFYGLTRFGGTHDLGTVFKLPPGGTLTTLASFAGINGAFLQGTTLSEGSDGALYGTTLQGGTKDYGTVFRITTDGDLTSLVSFDGRNGNAPRCGLTWATDGNWYGLTRRGGNSGLGTAFRMTPGGALTNLVNFTGPNGSYPEAALMQASNGILYGTTRSGGSNGYGTVFTISTNGSSSVLVHLDVGIGPACRLVEASDGCLYGSTVTGGSNNKGTLFKVTTNGVLTVLFSFDEPDGASPVGGLLLAADGNLYGTTFAGGAYDDGTIFRMTLDGVFTKLADFTYANGSRSGGGLIQAEDGSLYGTAREGGSRNGGTVFRLVLHSVTGIRMSGGNAVLDCSGVPYQWYDIQATTNLAAPVWETLSPPVTLDGNGVGQFQDNTANTVPTRFYRMVPQ